MLVRQIMALLQQNPELSDREITERIFGSDARHQHVNATCRQMEQKGLIKRISPAEGPILNSLTEVDAQPHSEPSQQDAPPLSEHAIKCALKAHLESEGWTIASLAFGKVHGADVDAERGDERWLIEVKGMGSRQPMNVNYFLSILGEILQRMDDPNARYSIALPDVPQFRNLWNRLPALGKTRTGITALLIDGDGNVQELA